MAKKAAQLKEQKHESRWFWTGYIKANSVNILVAEQSRGKSMLALQLVKELLKSGRHDERTLLDAPVCQKPKVLYLSTEMNDDVVIERLKQIGLNGRSRGFKDRFYFEYNPSPTLADLDAQIKETEADFIIIDIVGSVIAAEGLDTNSYADINKFVAHLKSFGKTFLLVHHMNKSKKAMGSVAMLSAMDTRLEMLSQFEEMVDEKLVVHQQMHIYGKAVPERYIDVKFDYPFFTREYTAAEEDGELDHPLAKLMECVIDAADQGVEGTYQQVAAKCKLIDKYAFSPRRMASLLKVNREILNGNNIYFEEKRMNSGMWIRLWYDPGKIASELTDAVDQEDLDEDEPEQISFFN